LVNEFTGNKDKIDIKVIDKLEQDDAYDLVVVAIRKNKIRTVLPMLSRNKNLKNILFLGNNVLGFDAYLEHLPRENVLFGFGNAGGGRKEHVIHYVDTEKPNGKRMSLLIGEMDSQMKERTRQIKALFESSGIPVEIVKDIDGWLKYHIAMVLPICAVLMKHDCDNYKLADNSEDLYTYFKAVKEAGNVLKELGYTKRQPFKFNLFYWFPEFLNVKVFQKILSTKFAEIAFAMHAKAASDEFIEHARDFKSLTAKTTLSTPTFDMLATFLSR
jgi:2-dehydropantoate 2-reductase